MNAPMIAFRQPKSAVSPQRIAVVGSGISGLSAAWLLSRFHNVTLFESEGRAGGHSNTVDVPRPAHKPVPVDTGFIVYNEPSYPNLTALFSHLQVPTHETHMTFAVSLDGGDLEYSGTHLNGLFAQRRNLVSARFWSMLRDLVRFYRQAPNDAARFQELTLDQYLTQRGYGHAFRNNHLYPMAAAIWSTPASQIGAYPLGAFVRFCENHNLLKLSDRPPWRTVAGGSREYVSRMLAQIGDVQLGRPVVRVQRRDDGASVITADNANPQRFDQVVIATHADQALGLLDTPSLDEAALLGAFSYSHNRAVLHRDPSLMPQRRAVWSAWNYLADRADESSLCVTYWMNALQKLPAGDDLFVTLNPIREPHPDSIVREENYTHPRFDKAAMNAQSKLWRLQGQQCTWFCGAYFGAGFHEDGLQAGLAVAEAIGGVRRPWTVPNESGRIVLPASVERA